MFLMRAATPAGPGPTCKLCWMYLLGLTYASGTGSLVSSDFRRSMTCCLRLGAMAPPERSLSIRNNGPFGPLFASLAVELTDNVAMGRRKLFTREDVLNKTIPVFWKHGLAETSVQDLEQATGVRKSGLYAEFKDKEDLFVASMRQYFDMLTARGTLTKQPLGWDNVEGFLKVCYGSWGQKGCFSVNSMREFADLPPKARQIMIANMTKARQLLIDNLNAARGETDDNESLADLIMTFFCGICLEQNLGPDRTQITKKIEAFMQLIRGKGMNVPSTKSLESATGNRCRPGRAFHAARR